MTKRRVAITGIGLVSPLGNSKESLWRALTSRCSGVAAVSGPPGAAAAGVRFAGEARAFTGRVEEFGPLDKEQTKAIRKGLKVMCRECQMGVAAAQLALADAGWKAGQLDPLRSGISFGTDHMITLPDDFVEGVRQCLGPGGQFQFDRWPVEGLPKMSPLWLLKYLPNMPASHLAIYNDLRGPNNSVTLREAAANVALGEAYQIIRRGWADVMLVGATGTRMQPLRLLHVAKQEELATGEDPGKASRPFDLHRSGMVVGEGAASLILEDWDKARDRGAVIYGEMVAAASSAAAARRRPSLRRAMENVMAGTLSFAGARPGDIGHLHAHGLSTRGCDAEEAAAIAAVFPTAPPTVAAKSYFGNLGAASGLVEIIASLLAMKAGRLFPILNYETPDPACPIRAVCDDATPPGESFVSVSVNPQGQASAVLVRAA